MAIPAHLSPADIDAFGREIEAIRSEVMDSRGERDARYIYRLIKVQRSMALGARTHLREPGLPAAVGPCAGRLEHLLAADRAGHDPARQRQDPGEHGDRP
ncbi:hypothetical protein LP420_26440 [Massilia sp. B-10]|nr:hypothetical protein LP420_26440 [Massilia sp. B-10]